MSEMLRQRLTIMPELGEVYLGFPAAPGGTTSDCDLPNFLSTLEILQDRPAHIGHTMVTRDTQARRTRTALPNEQPVKTPPEHGFSAMWVLVAWSVPGKGLEPQRHFLASWRGFSVSFGVDCAEMVPPDR